MAHKVVWLPEAYEDLRAIVDHISRDSVTYGAGMAQRVVDAARRLRQFPRIGRVVPEWDDPTVREQIVGNYRLIYRVEPDRVILLSVIHGARMLPDEIRSRGRGR